MPKNTKVDRCYQEVKKEHSEGSAARICQASTGESLQTGKPPKGKTLAKSFSDSTQVTNCRGGRGRFDGCTTVGEMRSKLKPGEKIVLSTYSSGKQVEVRGNSNPTGAMWDSGARGIVATAELVETKSLEGEKKSTRFTDWKEARIAAQQLANQTKLDVAIRSVKEYGKQGYNISLASRNDSDYARAEIVKPDGSKDLAQTVPDSIYRDNLRNEQAKIRAGQIPERPRGGIIREKGIDTQREIVKPKRGKDGLFIQPNDNSPERQTIEQHNRDRFANHFHYADPYTGLTRTYDEKGDYNCGRCNMANGSGCLLIESLTIDAEAGSCGDWENKCAGDAEIPLGLKTIESAGYGVATNGKGFGCHRCPYASKAFTPDSQGRDLYCGKGDMRVFALACCGINGAETLPMSKNGTKKGSKSMDIKEKAWTEKNNLLQVAFDFGKQDKRAEFLKWLDEVGLDNTGMTRNDLQQAYYRGRDGGKGLETESNLNKEERESNKIEGDKTLIPVKHKSIVGPKIGKSKLGQLYGKSLQAPESLVRMVCDNMAMNYDVFTKEELRAECERVVREYGNGEVGVEKLYQASVRHWGKSLQKDYNPYLEVKTESISGHTFEFTNRENVWSWELMDRDAHGTTEGHNFKSKDEARRAAEQAIRDKDFWYND